MKKTSQQRHTRRRHNEDKMKADRRDIKKTYKNQNEAQKSNKEARRHKNKTRNSKRKKQ